MHKMEQYVMAEKGESHQEHRKQFTEKKKEDLGCQVFYPTISHRRGRDHIKITKMCLLHVWKVGGFDV